MNEELSSQVIQKLAIKIAQLEVDKAILEAQVTELEQALNTQNDTSDE